MPRSRTVQIKQADPDGMFLCQLPAYPKGGKQLGWRVVADAEVTSCFAAMSRRRSGSRS